MLDHILVDEQDRHLLSQFNWKVKTNSTSKTKYAKVQVMRNNISKTLFLHRLILNAQPGQILDHINGNGLDNRRANLRFVTPEQSTQHRWAFKNKQVKFKGVSKDRNRFKARIRSSSKIEFIGCFATAEEAALAYNEAAKKHHGEYAVLNEVG